MRFLVVPNSTKALLFTPRTGSTSVARAVLTKARPDLADFTNPQALLFGSPGPQAELGAVIRDPVERFRSACALSGLTPSQALADTGARAPLFRPISKDLKTLKNVRLFSFETGLDSLAKWLGVDGIGRENESGEGDKPVLSEAELAAVLSRYAEDIEIHAAATAGLVHNGPVILPEPEPVVPSEVGPLQIRKALRAAGLKALVDQFLESLSEEQREEWEYATVVRRDNGTLNQAATLLGKTSREIDDLFRLAATL
jgi:hypothetical protein